MFSKVNVPQQFRQWVAGIGVSLLVFQMGLVLAWSSPYVAKLMFEDSPITITTDEASWVVSLLNFGRLMGAIVGAILSEFLGSKTTILITCFPVALNFVLFITASAVEYLYAARLLGGLGVGMIYVCFPIYLGEIADPQIRGALVSITNCGATTGEIAMVVMGPYLSLTTSSFVSLIPSFLLIPLFIYLPESPHFLIKTGKNVNKAKNAIRFYYKNCKDLNHEYEEVKSFVNSSKPLPFFKSLMYFSQAGLRKSLMLCIILNFIMQICGMANMYFYLETIVRNGRVTVISPSIVVIIATISGAIASGLFAYFVDKCGRRFLIVLSYIILVISMAAFAVHFMLLQAEYDFKYFEWIMILAAILLNFGTYLGMFSVPSVMLSELFPSNVKCSASLISNITLGLTAFLAAKSYQPLIDLIGHIYLYWIYAAINFLAVLYCLKYVPDTTGKSLQEIQRGMAK